MNKVPFHVLEVSTVSVFRIKEQDTEEGSMKCME
jgi:hypothetical protein